MAALAAVGALLLAALYVLVMVRALRGQLRPGWAIVFATRAWRQWGLPKNWAWALTRGIYVYYQGLAGASLALGLASWEFATGSHELALVVLALLVASLVLVPVVAGVIGARGTPKRWIHPDVREFRMRDY